MPLPRFERLPIETRTAFLAVARSHFARDGRDGASLNKIIGDSGFSKTSAYNYFDGKDDLFEAVVADSFRRVSEVLGEWPVARDEAALWRNFHAANDRLNRFLLANPDDRSLLAGAGSRSEPPKWLHAFFTNAVELGLVDVSPGRELLESATLAVLRSFDEWALGRLPAEADAGATARVKELLRRLWAC
ncbi:TetR/AcrR family transcriptional regulator [Methylobacterium nodulans]|uniref:Transcriptional regulator, TetR family n=1 Tax=Methylobacterium nodulans (strain LMG 21967 / CNCM I-2342 / ORS 2060) TaxID=460265 RepID=B8IWM9_METNO|nr:TetR/AcrR family transcriptional regulator [Methylobacterium nodulans]ACL62920.1 transcriptional regulator, TetR family [Methylobacterium nodulans ORS 2060]